MEEKNNLIQDQGKKQSRRLKLLVTEHVNFQYYPFKYGTYLIN